MICIGTELLIGKIVNTNAQWLAKYITNLGGTVRRVITIGDYPDEIATVLLNSLSRRPTFIITTGGLGPTFDDQTLKSIAHAFRIPLELNKAAHTMVKKKYNTYEKKVMQKIPLTPARIKMAMLPRGAKPLPNPVGTAPGVLLNCDFSRIIILPGVPKEMKAIFKTSIAPLIKNLIGDVYTYERSFKVNRIIESEMAPLIDATMNDNPNVYIKSHPKAPEPLPHIELHLSTTSNTKGQAKKLVEKAIKRIIPLIYNHGGEIEDLKDES